MLEKQRSDTTQQRLTRLSLPQLRQFFRETAVCVVQSGHEFAAIPMLQQRMGDSVAFKELLERSKQALW